jgi:hypothetical protein
MTQTQYHNLAMQWIKEFVQELPPHAHTTEEGSQIVMQRLNERIEAERSEKSRVRKGRYRKPQVPGEISAERILEGPSSRDRAVTKKELKEEKLTKRTTRSPDFTERATRS